MTTSFSWTDTAKIAFSSCMPSACLGNGTSGHDSDHERHGQQSQGQGQYQRISQARPDELRGLLVDPDSDTMSLHSNPGHSRRSRKRRSKANGMVLFGYHLFGKPQPIQLDEDGGDALYNSESGHRSKTPRVRKISTGTSSTLDSDAAPLDADAIVATAAAMSPQPTPSRDLPSTGLTRSPHPRHHPRDSIPSAASIQAAPESEEERRRRRKERKQRKKLEELMSQQHGDGEEFEGFQGSGGDIITGNFGLGSVSSGSASNSLSATTANSGRLRTRTSQPPASFGEHPMTQQEDEEEADLDGAVYARPSPRPPYAKGGSRGSATRSAGSGSQSSNINPHMKTNPVVSSGTTYNLPNERREKRSKSSGGTDTSNTTSTSRTSQSSSLVSPASSTFATPTPGYTSSTLLSKPFDSPNPTIMTSTVERGIGLFDADD